MSGAAAGVRSIRLRLPETLVPGPDERVRTITTDAGTLGELIDYLSREIDGFDPNDELYNFAVNGAMILHGERAKTISDGDEIEMLVAFSGG